MYTHFYSSPVGFLKITSSEKQIYTIEFAKSSEANNSKSPDVIKQCINELDEYFAGKRKEFNVPLAIGGTEFQNKVWNALLTIPYAQTISYGEQAKRIGNIKAVRAVGGANGKNKIVIIVPCHRVIGANGKLVGYGGEMWRKEWLLEFEKKHI